jgi:TM2 domain-containing membrane protein YozV
MAEVQGEVILMSTDRNPRRPKGALTTLGAVGSHLRIPWVNAWWSAALPGFGHMLISSHFKAFVLIIWEFIINNAAHLNLAIIFSFTGRFQEAREIIDHRWLLLYSAVYVYSVWDSYSETIEQNKYYILAEREDAPLSPAKISALDFSFAKKKRPVLAILWSFLTPGLGHLYAKKIMEGFFLMTIMIIIAYMSHLCEAMRYSFLGDFDSVRLIVDYQWLLYAPSLFGYSAYASYAGVVELNKYCDAEQARFLKKNYMNAEFTMPV